MRLFATSMHPKGDHIEERRGNHIEVQERCNGNCIELLATIHRYGADNMLPTEFMSASDTTEDNFTLAVSPVTDAPSFESDSWPEKWRTLEDMTAVSKVLDSDMKESLRSAGVKRPQPPDTKTQQSIASRYEALISVAVAIGTRHEIEGLLSALSAELLRVVDFDFIGLSRYDHETSRVDWRLCRPNGVIERDVIDGTQEETISAWVYKHRKPLIIPILNQEPSLHRKINRLAGEGVQSICAMPLTCANGCLGCFVIGSLQPDAYSQEDTRFLSLVTDVIATVMDNAINFDSLRRTQDDLKAEKGRLQLLLDLSGQIVSDLEIHQLLRTMSAMVRRMIQCDAVVLHLPDQETSSLRLFAIDCHEHASRDEENNGRVEGSTSGEEVCEVFRSRKPILSGDNAGYVLPLISRNRVLGVMELAQQKEQVLLHQDAEFVSQIANQLALTIENAQAYAEIKELKEQLSREKLYLEDEIRSERGFEEIIGRSSAIRGVLRQIETVAPTDSTVLIYGETGTGKELVARAIHERSSRNSKAFVKLNCAAIPTGLLESELFGHEKGAFTGAIMQRIGRFELANHGTAFLDEIGEISLELQPKLLRVLQEREFERLGSTRTIKTDARLIAATNRNLATCVEEGRFRADLFYRLNIFPIHVPPLRERPEDIPLLVRHFAQHFARRMNRVIDTIPSETMETLVHHSWPGNIRELQNLIEHSVIVSPGPVLRAPLASLQSHSVPNQEGTRHRTLEEAEREHIFSTLKETKWVISGPRGAAARLGMNRSTLQFRMRKLGIVRPWMA
jgi:formate hydrogenlyase transcriptional activator